MKRIFYQCVLGLNASTEYCVFPLLLQCCTLICDIHTSTYHTYIAGRVGLCKIMRVMNIGEISDSCARSRESGRPERRQTILNQTTTLLMLCSTYDMYPCLHQWNKPWMITLMYSLSQNINAKLQFFLSTDSNLDDEPSYSVHVWNRNGTNN